ncbi:MAG: hypothetical protein JSW63_06655, partial [Ignavibacterium sp.]
MKITLLIILFLGITFLGCSDNFDDEIVSTSFQIEKTTNTDISERLARSEKEIKNQAITPFIIRSQSINGVTGGEFIVDTTYVNYQGRLLYVYAEI